MCMCEHSCVHALVSYVLVRVFLFIFSMPFVCVCRNWNELLWRLGCLNKKEVAKERNVVVRRHSWSSMSKAFSAIKLTIWQRYTRGWLSILFLFIKIFRYENTDELTSTASSGGVILHVLTGVKRLASDNTAVSGTPSLDNYITPRLHCLHSLLIILLNSQWLESRWQRDKWQRVSRQWSPTLSTAQLSSQSFCQVTMELCRHTVTGCSFKPGMATILSVSCIGSNKI